MRTIKFRVWNEDSHTMRVPTWEEVGVLAEQPELNSRQTLMQFTGLLDVKGKEIYEGDVFVSLENDEVYVVGDMLPLSRHLDYLAENIGYFTDKKRKKFEKRSAGGQNHLDDWVSNPEFYEIIGNIYENPNLLS